MLSAIIFDMDGVIIDSEPNHQAAFNKAMEEEGVEMKKGEFTEFIGRKDKEALAIMKERYGLRQEVKELGKRKDHFYQESLSKEVKRVEGIIEFIKEASQKKIPIAIASSSHKKEILMVVETLEIKPLFQALVSGDEVENGKPAPDIFQEAATQINIPPEECIVIEDSPQGINGAKDANMTAIAIPSRETKGEDFSHADFRFSSIEDAKDTIFSLISS